MRLLPSEPTASDVLPMVLEDATQSISWIDSNNKYILTASEDGAVRLYQHSGTDDSSAPKVNECIRIVRREVLPVRSVALERASESPRAAICSDELLIRVANVEDPRQITLLTGHSRGVRAASWSPILPFLVSCGSDGDIRVWDMSSTEGVCLKIISNQLPALRPESPFTSLACWHPHGHMFAVPLKTHDIGLFNAPAIHQKAKDPSMWCMNGVLTTTATTTTPVEHEPRPSGQISALAFSPNGRYLAAATENCFVYVWMMESQKLVRMHAAEAVVTGLSWHPSKDVIAWTDMQGQLTHWESVLGTSLPSAREDVPMAESSTHAAGLEPMEHELDDLFDDTPLDDNAGDEPRPKRMRMIPPDVAGKSVLRQPSFQPSSTPMIAQRRYLAVSNFGTLTSIDQDTHQTVVFESYDTSARRNFRFTDHFGYTMASMASQGILFACEVEGGNPSVIFYRPFDDLPGIQMEWSVNLPPGETATAVALGGIPNVGSFADMHEGSSGVVDESFTSRATSVVSTSRGMLRFFGPSGMQCYVWALGAPVVALAACAYSVMVVYEAAASTSSNTHLAYMVIELSQWCIMQQGTLPVGPNATLTWLGFDELGTPAVFDSAGMLYTLNRVWRPGQGRWVPSLDCELALLPKDSDPNVYTDAPIKPRVRLWPIGVTGTHLLGLLIPSSQLYPQPSGPRPLVQELELTISMAQRESAATPLEELALRRSLLASAVRDTQAATGLELRPKRLSVQESDPAVLDMEADKALLQLVHLAGKADRYARALDATRSLHSESTLDAALKIAHFLHLPSLADRMERVRAPLVVYQQSLDEVTTRSCGTDALLRNFAHVPVPITSASSMSPSDARHDHARFALQQEGFGPRVQRWASKSTLAREGLSHFHQSPDLGPTPSDWSSSLHTATDEPTSSMPSQSLDHDSVPRSMTPTLPMRANPFARTHSVAKDRQLQKSSSFFDRADAASASAPDEADGGAVPAGKRSTAPSSSRQATLARFAYKEPSKDA